MDFATTGSGDFFILSSHIYLTIVINIHFVHIDLAIHMQLILVVT